MEPILVGNLFVISQINPTGQQECEILETQMLIVTHPYLDSLELIERWVCSEKEQWENSWKTSSSCQKTVMTSHWSMSGFNNYLNGLATLNLYSLGDCPLACLPQDYGRIYAVPLPSPEERGYPMIRRHFFLSAKAEGESDKKSWQWYFLPHGPQRNRRKKSLLRLVKFGWFFRNCGELLSKTPAPAFPNHLFIIPFQRQSTSYYYGAHKFAMKTWSSARANCDDKSPFSSNSLKSSKFSRANAKSCKKPSGYLIYVKTTSYLFFFRFFFFFEKNWKRKKGGEKERKGCGGKKERKFFFSFCKICILAGGKKAEEAPSQKSGKMFFIFIFFCPGGG